MQIRISYGCHYSLPEWLQRGKQFSVNLEVGLSPVLISPTAERGHPLTLHFPQPGVYLYGTLKVISATLYYPEYNLLK